jgi:hypothetical protein
MEHPTENGWNKTPLEIGKLVLQTIIGPIEMMSLDLVVDLCY